MTDAIFSPEQFGRTNRDAVLGHPAETLLVIGPREMRCRPRGWNVFERGSPGSGVFARAVDSAGNPPIPLAEFTEQQVAAARISEA